jgi:hypothetical protein
MLELVLLRGQVPPFSLNPQPTRHYLSLVLRYTNLVDNLANKEELVRCEIEGDEVLAPYKVSFPPVELPETRECYEL